MDFVTRSPARVRAAWPIALALISLLTLDACGTLVGAGAGGLAGSQFGKGDGKTAATVGGVVGGAIIGHAVTGN
jgi:outer membrane lipoprotein SlyB